MARRKMPPSRQRYEADHPTLTVRIPAEVKTSIQQAAAADGLSVSEWLQAKVAGHVTETADAYQTGLQQGERGGLYAGVLMATWARDQGRSHDLGTIRRRLWEDPKILAQTRQCCDRHRYGSLFARWIRSGP